MPSNKEKPEFDKKKYRTEKYSNKVRGKMLLKVINFSIVSTYEVPRIG